jgi:hypothetical protein
MTKCSGCGATNPPGRTHCVRCGTLLKAPAQSAAEAKEPKAAKEPMVSPAAEQKAAKEPPEAAGEAGAPESEDSGFRSLGSVALKKAGTGLAGLLGLRGKAKARSAGDAESSGESEPADAAPAGESPEHDDLIEGFQSTLLDQLPSSPDVDLAPADGAPLELDLSPAPVGKAKPVVSAAKRALPSLPTPTPAPAPGAPPQAAREPAPARVPAAPARAPATPVRVDSEAVIIGAPPLPPSQAVPEVVRAIPAGPIGVVGTMIYGMKAPRVAQRQRDVVNAASAYLSKLKKKEHELIVALGKAARLHDLVPDDVAGNGIGGNLGADDGAARPELDEDGGLEAGGQKGEMSTDELRLIELGHQHENLKVQLGIAQRALADGEDRLDQMRQRETELRSPPRDDMPDAEVAQRVKEYEAVKVQRVKAERELQVLQEKVTQAKAPLRRLKDEIDQLRVEIQSTNKRRMEAEARKRGQRPSASEIADAGSNPVARDEDLGRQLIVGSHDPALRQLVVSTEGCRRRIAKWEGVLREQQSELERYDEPQARKGFFMVVGSLIGVFIVLAGAGEIIRRILLAME